MGCLNAGFEAEVIFMLVNSWIANHSVHHYAAACLWNKP